MTLSAGFSASSLTRQFASADALGHDHVGQQKLDLVPVLFPDRQGGDAINRLEHTVTIAFENAAHQNAQGSFVFHDEDGFIAAADFGFGSL